MSDRMGVWQKWGLGLTTLVAGAGAAVAWHLTELHRHASPEQLEAGICGAHQVLDCDSALHSSFATLFGVPISLLGLAFYIVVLGLSLLGVVGSDGPDEGEQAFGPAALAVTGFVGATAYSVFLAGVSAVALGTFCPFCAILYGINLVGLVTACLWAGMGSHRVVLRQLKSLGDLRHPRVIGAAGVFVAVVVVGHFVVDRDEPAEPVAEQEANAETADRPERQVNPQAQRVDPREYRIDGAPSKGPEDAPVHVVEFSSFSCPFCGSMAGEFNKLLEAYPDEVRLEFRHFPLAHQAHSHLASRAAYCAGEQDAFWAMHGVLFAIGQPDLSPKTIEEGAREVGLDVEKFQECLEQETTHRAVDRDVADGVTLGINATPTFFINGQRMRGALSVDVLKVVVDEKLREAIGEQ